MEVAIFFFSLITVLFICNSNYFRNINDKFDYYIKTIIDKIKTYKNGNNE
jgi:hypothetical protein